MNLEEKAKETFSPLSEVDLSYDDKLDILSNLRREMSTKKPRRKFKFGLIPTAAAVAAVVIVAGVIGYDVIHTTPFTTASNQVNVVTNEQILHLLPKGAELIASNSGGDVIQRLDLGNDGNVEYASLYQYSYDGVKQSGAIIVGRNGNKLKTLWQYKGPGLGSEPGVVQPISLVVKDVLGNGTKDVVFTGQVGAGANCVEVISCQNGAAKTLFATTSTQVDIGHYGTSSSNYNQIVTWSLDTGVLYNFQVYGWNSKEQQFDPIANTSAANYFKNTVVPYYKNLTNSTQGKQDPKMVTYGLASAYFYAGEYSSALTEVNAGLKLSRNDYPPNSEFVNLKNQISQKARATRDR